MIWSAKPYRTSRVTNPANNFIILQYKNFTVQGPVDLIGIVSLRLNLVSTLESTPTHLPWATLCQSYLKPMPGSTLSPVRDFGFGLWIIQLIFLQGVGSLAWRELHGETLQVKSFPLTFLDTQTTYCIAFSRSPFHLKESRQLAISMGKEDMPPSAPCSQTVPIYFWWQAQSPNL
jgi:hypothetical protein